MDQELVKPDLEEDLELLPVQEEMDLRPEKQEAIKEKKEELMDQELAKPDLEEDSDPKYYFK